MKPLEEGWRDFSACLIGTSSSPACLEYCPSISVSYMLVLPGAGQHLAVVLGLWWVGVTLSGGCGNPGSPFPFCFLNSEVSHPAEPHSPPMAYCLIQQTSQLLTKNFKAMSQKSTLFLRKGIEHMWCISLVFVYHPPRIHGRWGYHRLYLFDTCIVLVVEMRKHICWSLSAGPYPRHMDMTILLWTCQNMPYKFCYSPSFPIKVKRAA